MCSAKRPRAVVPPAPLQAPKVALGGQRDSNLSQAETAQIRGERRDVAETRLNESANAQREVIDQRNIADWYSARDRYKSKRSKGRSPFSSAKGSYFKRDAPNLLVKHESAGGVNGQAGAIADINRLRIRDQQRAGAKRKIFQDPIGASFKATTP